MKLLNHLIKWIFCFLIFFSSGCNSIRLTEAADRPHPVTFGEIWGYLMKGEEKKIKGNEPFTHIFYFSANPDAKGRIRGTIVRPEITLRNGLKPSIHLVISELSNKSLSHFSINPQYGIRDLLIDDIISVSESFDGVQIDFESVLPEDAGNFLNFLSELKTSLPSKMLSVALPARTQDSPDAYSYKDISQIADRVVIMAYDEHWSGGTPGPVASLPWCSGVVTYAKSVMDNEKIIMGLPLYGRAWQDKKLAKAYIFSQLQNIIEDEDIEPDYKPELGNYFTYSEKVKVSVFYDDKHSIAEKLKLYKKENINSISFWRIGQGPANLWDLVISESNEY